MHKSDHGYQAAVLEVIKFSRRSASAKYEMLAAAPLVMLVDSAQPVQCFP